MSDGTKIEWTDATLNVVNGCSVLSPGCTNCYAMRSGGRNLPHHPATGLTKPTAGGHVWTGEVRFNDKALLLPLRWRRPRKIFWNAHGDLFHDAVPDAWIDRCFAIMALTPHHIHQVLTKRPARMRDYMTTRDNLVRIAKLLNELKPSALWNGNVYQGWQELHGKGFLPNVWLGVSVEDQKRADERVPVLLETPAAVRWLSCEPLLGPVDLTAFMPPAHHHPDNVCSAALDQLVAAARASIRDLHPEAKVIDWVVAGGESGPGARPMHPDWARALRDQCVAAGVPFLFKQWGEFGPDTGPDEDRDRQGFTRDRVMEGAGPCAAWNGERWEYAEDGYAMPLDLDRLGREWMYRLGKKRNGRLLDGVQHDGFPGHPLGQSATLAETP